jgi:hypothetical protein
MFVTDNYQAKNSSAASAGPIVRRATGCASIARDAGSEPGICGRGETTEHLHHARSNVGIEIVQELLLLIDQIIRDPRAEPLTLPRGAQRCRATVPGIGALLDVFLPNQAANHATRGALVQEQALRQRAEAQRAVRDDRLERVALRHRYVVAADAVAVPKLIDADKIGNRLVQAAGVAVERGLPGISRWGRASHCCY